MQVVWLAWVPVGGFCVVRESVFVVALWWLCREIELSNIVLADVTFPTAKSASIRLPASKSDFAALGTASGGKRARAGTAGRIARSLPRRARPRHARRSARMERARASPNLPISTGSNTGTLVTWRI